MIFENVDALHSPINAAGKLQLITIGVGPNHGPNVSKYLLHPPPINLIPPTPQNSQEAGHQVAQNLLHPPEADSTRATPPPSTPSERPVEQPTRGQRIRGRSRSPLPSQLGIMTISSSLLQFRLLMRKLPKHTYRDPIQNPIPSPTPMMMPLGMQP